MTTARDEARYARQGFGGRLDLTGKAALLIVDFTVGFADPAQLGGGNIAEAIEPTRRVLAAFRAGHLPIAHSHIVFPASGRGADLFCLKARGLASLTDNEPAAAFLPELAPEDGELVVRKGVPSAFFGTPLAQWLAEQRVQVLFVAGVTTSGCVRASVVDAMSHGFSPVVLADCVGDRAQAPHDASLFDMQQKYAEVMLSTEALALAHAAGVGADL